MGQPELFLEFKREGLKVRHHRVTPKRKIFVIGSSPEADLRIGGDAILVVTLFYNIKVHTGSCVALRLMARQSE